MARIYHINNVPVRPLMAKKKWVITGHVTISVTTEVEAETRSEAIELAADQPMQTLCHQCAQGPRSQEWCTSGELDGEVQIIEVRRV